MPTSLPFALVQSLAPEVHLHPAEEFMPCSVDWYLSCVSLWKDNSECVLPLGEVNADSLLHVQNTIGEAKLSMRIEPPPYDEIDIQTHPTYLGQGTTSPCYFLSEERPDGLYYLRYFFFYAYNGGLLPNYFNPLGYMAHEGDWEYITVLLGWNVDNQECTLHAIEFSGHGYTTYKKLFPGVSTPIGMLQPITVFSALHSHASYGAAGDYPLLNIPAIFRRLIGGYDRTGDGPLWSTRNNLVEILNGQNRAQPLWANYKGDWGTDVVVDSIVGSALPLRKAGPSGPLEKVLQLAYDGSVDVYYSPQDGQHFRCSKNFEGWDTPSTGYLNVQVDSGGRQGVPVFSFNQDKTGRDIRWYSFKKNGDSYPTTSNKPGNPGGSGQQEIYIGTESPVPPDATSSDTYKVRVLWSAVPLSLPTPATKPSNAVLMGCVDVTYQPQGGQRFRCSPNIDGWNPSELDNLYFEVQLGTGQSDYPVFAVDHDKVGADTRWYTGVTHGSYFSCLSQNGGPGSQKIYLGTISALPDGVNGSDKYTVKVYRVASSPNSH